jgi:hypothetical protein
MRLVLIRLLALNKHNFFYLPVKSTLTGLEVKPVKKLNRLN